MTTPLDALALSAETHERLRHLGYQSAEMVSAALCDDESRALAGRALGVSPVALAQALAPWRVALPKRPDLGFGLDLQALEAQVAKAAPWVPGPDLMALSVPASASLLGRFDGRPARDQHKRGTCVAFAACAALEASRGDGTVLSPQFLFHHLKRMEGYAQTPGSYGRIAVDALNEVGTCREQTWPYDPRPYGDLGLPFEGPPPPAEAEQEAFALRTQQGLLFTTIRALYPVLKDPGDPTQRQKFWLGLALLLHLLWEGQHGDGERQPTPAPPQPGLAGIQLAKAALSGALGPPPRAVVGSFAWAGSSGRAAQASGVFSLPLPTEVLKGHAMAIVGYADDAAYLGGGYLLVRNSYGADWPQHQPYGSGVARLPYGYAALHLWEVAVPLLAGDAARLAIDVGGRQLRSASGAAVPAAPPAPADCRACGAALAPAARFCGACGSPVHSVVEPTAAPPARARGVQALKDRHAARMARVQQRVGGGLVTRSAPCRHCGATRPGRCAASPSGRHES